MRQLHCQAMQRLLRRWQIKPQGTDLSQKLAALLPAFFDAVIAETRPLIHQYVQQGFAIETKSDDSPVTVADRETERVIRTLIETNFPDHKIIGEEFGYGDASQSDNLGEGYCWVIDPIDGTRAFVAGKPTFGTLLGLCYDGVPLAGMIDMPMLDSCYTGILGPEPVARLNGNPISVRTDTPLANAAIATTSPEAFTADGWAAYRPFSQTCSNQLYGGDCHNYALLAAGQIDLVIEHGLAVHDVMALVPVIQAAGGIATDWSGKPLRLGSSDEIIAAGSTQLHKAALQAFQ